MNKNIRFVGLILAGLLAASLSSAMTLTPEDVSYRKGGEAYMDGENKLAQEYFEEVLRLNPDNEKAQKALREVRRRLKDEEEKSYARDKKLANAKYKKGKEFMRSGDYVPAIDAFHEALNALPDHAKAQKSLKKIEKKMEQAAKRKKLNLTDWAYVRGTLAYLDKDWGKAYRIWSERSSLAPDDVRLKNAMAQAREKYLSLMMAEKEDFLRRGAREFYRQGMYQQSINNWKKVLKLGDEDKEALEGIARAENEILKMAGNDRDRRINTLLEEGLEFLCRAKLAPRQTKFSKIGAIGSGFRISKGIFSQHQ